MCRVVRAKLHASDGALYIKVKYNAHARRHVCDERRRAVRHAAVARLIFFLIFF